jgi:hypothetical protein
VAQLGLARLQGELCWRENNLYSWLLDDGGVAGDSSHRMLELRRPSTGGTGRAQPNGVSRVMEHLE